MEYKDLCYENSKFMFECVTMARGILYLLEEGNLEDAMTQQKLLIAKMGN